MAMMFLSNWLNGFGQAGHLPVSSRYISGKEVNFSQNGALRDALKRGGTAVVRLDLDGWHYVLLTGLEKDLVYLFDPYYRDKPFPWKDIRLVPDCPNRYNRIIPIRRLERDERKPYAFGPTEEREAVLLFNERTKLTAEATVEYMI